MLLCIAVQSNLDNQSNNFLSVNILNYIIDQAYL